ncbi:MAG: hypothetical protein IJ800_03740 [Clostridia bacterium]|nr:hypothetical protein [Clostridia bacterium]
MLDFLPQNIKSAVFAVGEDNLREIRIRANRKIIAVYYSDGEIIKKEIENTVSGNQIENMILKLSDYSFASIENNLKMGFITSSQGERVGIAGECVVKDGKIVSIKNITSLCVRFPHCAVGCSNFFFDKFIVDAPKNCLIISPPFHGKTTFARDLGRNYCDKLALNVLYLDERDEFSGGGVFDLGKNSDVLRYCDKPFGFINGVRVLNPEVIICDELMTDSDVRSLSFAANSGVKVIATAHGRDLSEILNKEDTKNLIKLKVFDYYVVLADFKVVQVCDGNLKKVC